MSIAADRDPSLAERQEMLVSQFRQDIGEVGRVALFDATINPGVDSVNDAVSYFVNCCAKPKTAFALNGFEDRLGDIDNGLTFSVRHSNQRRKSAHGVFFGSLDCGPDSTKVAVKPLGNYNAWRPAARETILTQGFRDIGFYTLNPLGVIISGEEDPDLQRAYFLTELYENLTTLESIKPEEWQRMLQSPDNNQGMIEIWEQCAREAAFAHDLGKVKHGDLWGRNYATSVNVLGFMIDFESAEIGVGDDPDAEERYNYSSKDIYYTLLSICLPHDVPGSDYQGLEMIRNSEQESVSWEKVFRFVFFDEYLRIRRALAKEECPAAAREIAEELAQLEADVQLWCKHKQPQTVNALKRFQHE